MHHKIGGDQQMISSAPVGQGRHSQQAHGIVPTPNVSQILSSPALQSRYGFNIFQPPTTGALVYPGLYGRQAESQRQMDSVGLRRELDFRKRPSMLSDFHLSTSSQEAQLTREPGTRPDELLLGRPTQADTKKTPLPAYTPQVEAISPTPDDQASSAASTDRDHILERISVIDHEIAVTESNLKKMQKRKQELEEAAAFGGCETAPELPVSSQTTGNLIERIYAETRRQAAAVHAKVASIGPPMESLPLYRQPSDRKEYEEIRAKHEVFKPKLIAYLRRIKRFQDIRERYLTERYNQLMIAWRKKVERMERHPKRLAKEQKYREVFEKVFPELRKQREERERTARASMLGTRAGLDDGVYFSLSGEMEEDERIKMRQNAIVPPMLLDSFTRTRMRYVNNNGLVRDPLAEHQNRYDLFKNIWTDDEKRIFKEKFIQYGKNFAAIALFLEKKTTKDCVQYYYLTKKSENYKQLLRRKNTRRGKPYRAPQLPRPEDMRESVEAADGDVGENDGTGQREPECTCMVCKAKLDSANPGRVLTRSCYEQYGLDPESLHGQNVRICQKCRLGIVKRKHSQCPVGTCTTARRRVKPSRIFPAKWLEMSDDDRRIISEEFQFSLDVNKCCGSCFKRLLRRCDMVALPEEALNEDELALARSEAWSDEEIAQLKEVTTLVGTNNWATVAEKLNKPLAQCRRQYLLQKQSNGEAKSKSLPPKLGQVAGIEEEEEEDETVNSDEEETPPAPAAESKPPSPKAVKNEVEAAVAEGLIPEASRALPNRPIKEDVLQMSQILPNLDTSLKQALSGSRESVRSGGDDSCATLSADEGQSETETGQQPLATATSKKADVVDTKSNLASGVPPLSFIPTNSIDVHRGSLRPESLPIGQPYKPKSAHIFRLENERRAKEAVANATTSISGNTVIGAPSAVPASSSRFPLPSTCSSDLLSVISKREVIRDKPADSVRTPSRMTPTSEAMATNAAGVAARKTVVTSRNTESPEVIEIFPPKAPGQLKSPPSHSRQLNTPSDGRNRGSLTQGTPVILPGVGPTAVFATPQVITSSPVRMASQPLPIPSRILPSAVSSPMEGLPKASTPAGTMATSMKNEESHGVRAASAGLSKTSRPVSSEAVQMQPQQQSPLPSTPTNLSEQQQQQYQALLQNQALANDQYIRAKQLGLNEQMALYNAALAAREHASYAGGLPDFQQQHHHQQLQQSLQANPELSLVQSPVPGGQYKLPDSVQALLALAGSFQGYEAATQAALLQQHYYKQWEQRRLDQQRTLYEHHQRMLAAAEQQRIMSAAAAAALAEQTRVAGIAAQERIRLEEQRQEQLRQERLQADRAQQDYRRQLLEQQRLMEAQQRAVAQRQSPLTHAQMQHGAVPSIQQYQHPSEQFSTKQSVLSKAPLAQSTPRQSVKQESGSPFARESTSASQDMAMARVQDLQRQHFQQQEALRQQKAASTAGRKSIIQRTAALEPSPVNHPQPISTPPAAAGIPTKAAMKEFPTTLSSPAVSVRTVTPSTVHHGPSPGFPIPVTDSRHLVLTSAPARTSAPVLVPSQFSPAAVTKALPTNISSVQAATSIDKSKGMAKLPTASSTSPVPVTQNTSASTSTAPRSSKAISGAPAPQQPTPTLAVASSAADINLVNLVDSIITKHHGDDKITFASEVSPPVHSFPFAAKPVTTTIPSPSLQRKPKKEDATPAIVPISPPPVVETSKLQSTKPLIELPAASHFERHIPAASSHQLLADLSIGASNRVPTTAAGSSGTTFFQCIEDIIASNYSGLATTTASSQSTSKTEPTNFSVAVSASEVASTESISGSQQTPTPKPKALQRPSEEQAMEAKSISGKVEPAPIFEYDLEPVSPPEQNSEESSSSSRLPSFSGAKPTGSVVVSGAGSLPTPQAAPFPLWTTPIRPVLAPSPMVEDSTIAKSVSPAAPFMAWTVFTLPDAGTEVLSSGIQPTVALDQQQQHNQSGDGNCAWHLSSISSTSLDDLESSRAVAALLETEMRPDSASARVQSADIPRPDPTRQCPLPTYEPLSDDES